EWVLKFIKPQAQKRLLESLAALDQLLTLTRPLAMTHRLKRLIKEIEDLSRGLRLELDLGHEAQTIRKASERFAESNQTLLRLPSLNEAFCTRNVICMQRFRGVSLA